MTERIPNLAVGVSGRLVSKLKNGKGFW
jgi:hypothetical protein